LRGGFKYGFRLEAEVENRVYSMISLFYVLGLNYPLVSWFSIRSRKVLVSNIGYLTMRLSFFFTGKVAVY